jgi:regulator of sigma E protease
MSWVLTFVGFVALIIFHELGHFAAAKAVGMRVERFSLFFGPPLVKLRRGETEYAIGPIPAGGYVKITGMNPREDIAPEIAHRAYYRQSVWKRVVVISAGPAVNLVLAFLIFWVIYMSQGIGVVHHGQPALSNRVAQIAPGTPAVGALRVGDRVVGADGRSEPPANLPQVIGSHRCAGVQRVGCVAATPVRLTVVRDGTTRQISILPRYNAAAKGTRVGFGFESQTAPAGPVKAAGQSVTDMWQLTSTTVSKFVQIFTSSQARSQIHSAVGISDVLHQEFSFSVAAAFYLLGLVSLSLAVINLFPFLPLDGGHIFWALAEKVRGRAIPFAVMERASAAGIFVVLFIFMIGLTNDINTFSSGGFHVPH